MVSDPERALSFMSGVTRWEIEGDERVGLGARYRMLLRVGSAEVGGLIEIVEWDPPKELAWTSITGVDQRGRWRLRSVAAGRTQAEIRLAAGVAGSGRVGLDRGADRPADRQLASAQHRGPAHAARRARADARPGGRAARGPRRARGLERHAG